MSSGHHQPAAFTLGITKETQLRNSRASRSRWRHGNLNRKLMFGSLMFNGEVEGATTMKKILMSLFTESAVAFVWMTATAQKQPASDSKKYSPAVATSEHKMFSPDQLQWSPAP